LTLLRDRRAPNRPLTQLLDNILKTDKQEVLAMILIFQVEKKFQKFFHQEKKLDKA
jgi:hypothetical protein